jgi:hypothetical protein
MVLSGCAYWVLEYQSANAFQGPPAKAGVFFKNVV